MPKFFTMRLCMGGGHFDNRADEYFQEKEGKQKKNKFQLKEVHYKVRLGFLETRITHACCSTDILFGSTISEPSLDSKIPSQMGLSEGIS